jgi:hypothetical protein
VAVLETCLIVLCMKMMYGFELAVLKAAQNNVLKLHELWKFVLIPVHTNQSVPFTVATTTNTKVIVHLVFVKVT